MVALDIPSTTRFEKKLTIACSVSKTKSKTDVKFLCPNDIPDFVEQEMENV